MDLHLRGLTDKEHERLKAISWSVGSNKNTVVLAAVRSALRDEKSLVASVRSGEHRSMKITIPRWARELAVERRREAKRDAARLMAKAKTSRQKADELYALVHPNGGDD